jgi:hypothetical protein
MWPFSKKPIREHPQVALDGTRAWYDHQRNEWSFSIDGIDYSVRGPKLDVALFHAVRRIPEEIAAIKPQIMATIREYVTEWCHSVESAHIVCIDVTSLLSNNMYDITYAGDDDWADLGVNIIVTDGKITQSYAGD